MPKVGRNAPCPCGSGKKYKHCCANKDAEIMEKQLPSGRFTFKSGSYGDQGSYVPSILCHKEVSPGTWTDHFCLVKPDANFSDEDSASRVAEEHLAKARGLIDAGGSIQEFALSLRHKGYKNLTDFNVIKER